ncbi:hypothetical protein [Burkholderia ubonensis]|uniref:hypothetical protein n=1 Tax=Burkholderia ubonensis TaxID=101571 RepID=UPI0012FBFFFE|nr:hypothetical protein [Burkholderia ubonensis]
MMPPTAPPAGPFGRIAVVSLSARLRGLMSFALLGYVACDLPTRLQDSYSSWTWNCAGAIACAIAGYMSGSGPSGRCARRSMRWCIAAVCVGLTLDATRTPIDTILNVCGGALDTGVVWNTLTLHLRWFPMSTSAMLAVVLLHHAGRINMIRLDKVRVASKALVWIGIEIAAMLLAMTAGMAATQATAFSLALRWDASGVAFAMLASMLAFYELSHRAARLAERIRNKRRSTCCVRGERG